MRSVLPWFAAAAALAAVLLAAPGSATKPFVPIAFTENAHQAGIDFVLKNDATPEKHQIEAMPAGVAVIDYDNDGYEDLFFINGATVSGLRKADKSYWNRLYRNNGNGTFTDVTEKAGVRGSGYSMGVAVGDFDNDGWDDLFVVGVDRDILYRNNHDGTFVDVTSKSGIAAGGPGKTWSISAGWFDYDNDGRLDLFIVKYCKWAADKEPHCGGLKPGFRAYCDPRMYEGLPNALYHNNGDGTFTDVSASSGIAAHIGKGMAVAFADYDADGRPDVLVTNDTERNFLFHNDGNGKFSEVGLKAGVAFNNDGRALSSMGADFRDVDNDGKPDLVITALSNETFPLFLNLGGSFRDASYSSGLALLTLPWAGWSVGIFDLNNDGLKDIFTANSLVMDNIELFSSRTYHLVDSVFANVGNAEFVDARAGSAPGVFKPRAHRGCAFGDFDNDGRVDIAVSSLNDSVELLQNVSDPGQHWLDVLLTGTVSNRDAIGATVRLVTPSGRTQYNHVTTSVGYASSSSRRVHFGLGPEAVARKVEIRWPSGLVQTIDNIKADQCLRVTESRPSLTSARSRSASR